MPKEVTRIVLTGGPAAGKTSLISRIMKDFKQEDGWRVITIPETATMLISGFGLGPFEGCMSMLDFQYYVIADQLHKEKLALKAAEIVPQDKILIIYDRAIFDDLAYITDEEFRVILDYFGRTPDDIMAGYDAVLHLVSCAKGAEFAYNYGNAARFETIEDARRMDDRTIAAWSSHPNFHIIDNSIDFEDKLNRAMAKIYEIIGESMPEKEKRKYLIELPDASALIDKYGAVITDMTQTYLADSKANTERRIRKQKNGNDYMYFYTEKRSGEDGKKWVTEKPISEKTYNSYLLEANPSLHPVSKEKLCFSYDGHDMAADIYPFSTDKAILFVYGPSLDSAKLPPEIKMIQDVSGNPEYKNKRLAEKQAL